MKLAKELAREVVCNNFIHGMEPAANESYPFLLTTWGQPHVASQTLRAGLYDRGGFAYEGLRRRWAELLDVEHQGNSYFMGTAQ